MPSLPRILLISTLTFTLGAAACCAQNLESISMNSLANPGPVAAATTSSSTPTPTQDLPQPSKLLSRTYQWSIVALGAATASDIASSLKFSSDGQRESNGFLSNRNGGYGAKGALLEAGVVGASLLVQHYVIKRHPSLQAPFAISNFAFSGFQAWNVHHNVSY
jgi:hypothetical protein